MSIVYLGLGSNLGQPQKNIERAVAHIANLPNCHLLRCSELVHSKAMGPPQPDYVNAVAALSTTFTPLTLLFRLQQIEQQLGRQQHQRWAARCIDLDILLFDDIQLVSEALTLPHPGIWHRPFVFEPLEQIYQKDAVLPKK